MASRLALATYLAAEYDEAINWFRTALGWVVAEETDLGAGKRWVRVAASANAETGLLFARATGGQTDDVGRAAGGRIAYVLQVDDFSATHRHMIAAGVVFEETPRHESYGTVAVFRDLYGNRWDLIGPGIG